MSEQKRIDYGEPWTVEFDDEHDIVVDVVDSNGDDRVNEAYIDDAARIVSCVNALAGVEDPQGAIEKAREALALALHLDVNTHQYAEIEAALAALTPNPKDR